MEEQYLTSLCAAEAIRSVLPRLEHVTILIPPSEITDLPGGGAGAASSSSASPGSNPHAGKLHVYTRVAATSRSPAGATGGPHLYVHSKMAVIDDELLLIGSANCNNRGWESDSELVVACVRGARPGQLSTAQRLRMALWAHHLDQPPRTSDDPVRSRALWDRAPTRHVCRYIPTAGQRRAGSAARPHRRSFRPSADRPLLHAAARLPLTGSIPVWSGRAAAKLARFLLAHPGAGCSMASPEGGSACRSRSRWPWRPGSAWRCRRPWSRSARC